MSSSLTNGSTDFASFITLIRQSKNLIKDQGKYESIDQEEDERSFYDKCLPNTYAISTLIYNNTHQRHRFGHTFTIRRITLVAVTDMTVFNKV